MKRVSLELARELIDFAPTVQARAAGFGESQLHGTVAAYNMLAQNRIAYLADEVGMGKTYVALGVAGLMRHLNPSSRIMVIAPRENIQQKWVKELGNFVRANWRIEDNCMKNLHGSPVRRPIVIDRFESMARAIQINDQQDLFLRMTSFSASVKDDRKAKWRKMIREFLPWFEHPHLSSRSETEFRDAIGCALNALVPPLDLLIVDEAHNLKHGFGPSVSNRNRLLGLALGHPSISRDMPDSFDHRARCVLCLSATPFEYEYRDLFNQLDVLGMAGIALADACGNDPLPVRMLADDDVDETRKEAVVQRMMIRRVAYLKVNNERLSKNMYRREWRRGGYDAHDDPMQMTNPKQRLIVALMQKKVAETLADPRFNNSFQIGMLSSFESFLESLSRSTQAKRRQQCASQTGDVQPGDDEIEGAFYGEQDATQDERQGVDTAAIERVAESYRDLFGQPLPHPKLDATVGALADAFDTGEKALVFVRRVATVRELQVKLNRVFDQWIRARMIHSLPQLEPEIQNLFERYDRDRRGLEEDVLDSADDGGVESDLTYSLDEDAGGNDTFFAWFFRGEGPARALSGASFQKNRLQSAGSVYSTLFDDNYAAWLLGYPNDVVGAMATTLGISVEDLVQRLRPLAYARFSIRKQQESRYPRAHVFEAYQVAALQLLEQHGGSLGRHAAIVLRERFDSPARSGGDPPPGFPDPGGSLGASTFFTELARDADLRDSIWPDEQSGEFNTHFRRREERRELISAMARLGLSFVDLYLLAVEELGSFSEGRQAGVETDLPRRFVALLRDQRGTAEFNAYHELEAAATHFDLIMSVNFPEIREARITDFSRIFAQTLGHQVPVAGMAGGVNKRVVRQFRMPGFPIILATTDVLQEGEDLHTFCRRVVHYGITWTPSAMEQRTGRIDRIGSLVQRKLDGAMRSPNQEELIQVYLPHLEDTVEVFQIRRVLKRLNKFIAMVNRRASESPGDTESRINIDEAVFDSLEYIPPVEGLLESAYPVRDEWLMGPLGDESVRKPRIGELETLFAKCWDRLKSDHEIQESPVSSRRGRAGMIHLTSELAGGVPPSETESALEFELELRSQEVGDAVLIRCISQIGVRDLDHPTIDLLYELQQHLGCLRLCAREDGKTREHHLAIENDRLFHLHATQHEEVEDLLLSTVHAARRVRATLEFGQKGAKRRAKTAPVDGHVLDMMLELTAKETFSQWSLDWDRAVLIAGLGQRHQEIHFERHGSMVRLSSTALPASAVRKNVATWYRLARLAWERNAHQEIVSFGFDGTDRLIGVIEHPADQLDAEELEIYVDALARECDRFEYLLSGKDLS